MCVYVCVCVCVCVFVCVCVDKKGYNTQQGLVSLIEKWIKILGDKGSWGAVLMDLLKAFDTLNHKILRKQLCETKSKQMPSISFRIYT